MLGPVSRHHPDPMTCTSCSVAWISLDLFPGELAWTDKLLQPISVTKHVTPSLNAVQWGDWEYERTAQTLVLV